MVAWKEGNADVIIWKNEEVIFHQTLKKEEKIVELIKENIPFSQKEALKITIHDTLEKDKKFRGCPTCVAGYLDIYYHDFHIRLDRLLYQTITTFITILNMYYFVEIEYKYAHYV